MTTLTEKQSAILDFIREEIKKNGFAPSTREIQRHFGFASQTAAVQHLRALESKGAIARGANKARAIYIPGDLSKTQSLLISLINY